MANEITVTYGLKVVNGALSMNVPASTFKLDQTTARGGGPGSVNVGTTEETIDFGDIAPGYVLMVNQDATNYVQVGFATTDYGFRLLPNGGAALFRMESGATVYVKADTAACNVNVQAVSI